MGLFTGMSVLSLMELLFWFCRGVANCVSCKRKCGESKEEDDGKEEEGNGKVDKIDAETPSTAVVEVPMVGEMEEEQEEGRRLNTQSQI